MTATIQERILQYLEYKKVTPYKFCKDLDFPMGSLNKRGSIGTDKYLKIIKYYRDLNPEWLLSGEGSMLKEGADAPHLEPKNWIEDDLSRYEGSHDRAALERVGLRLDEICKVRNISYSDLANLLKIERITLLTYIAGNRRVLASLLETIMLKMPEINPMWLLLGYGDIFIQKISSKEE